jgi:DNA-binding winged helix-turn-helix (wHTH) protein
LSGQPFEILAILLERTGDVVTRKELQERLWPADTFVDFEHGMNNAIKKLRTALGDAAHHPLYVETPARVGYRFIAPAERVQYPRRGEATGGPGATSAAESADRSSAEGAEKTVPPSERTATEPRHAWPVRRLGLGVAIAATLLLAGLAGFEVYRSRVPRLAFGEPGTVVVADFVNTTGDPIFDVTLRKGVEVDLSQSPFLDVLPRPQIWKSLEMMGRSPDEKLTDKTGLEVCQRANAQALLAGSIVGLGQHFVITIDALNCRSGDSIALEQVQAESKEAVLRSLGEATTRLRAKLGESLGSLQQFGTRLEQATTGSLDALKVFSLGDDQRARGKNAEAIPFYQHAIDLDPSFVLAYARIGAVYYNIYEFARAKEYCSKAFEMRPRVSKRERLYLSARYYENVTGERSKTIENYELWRQLYPHDWIPASNLTNVYTDLGQYDKAIPHGLDAVRLNPDHSFPYIVLARAY